MFFPHAPTSLNAFEILTAQHMGYLRRVTISGDNWGRGKKPTVINILNVTSEGNVLNLSR